MTKEKIVDVVAFIDQERFGSFQITIVVICALIAMLDGFDTQAMAFAAPAIAAKLDLNVSSFGPVFGAVLLGLMLGALVMAPVADRYGRKPIIIGSLAFFGIFSLSTVLATSIPELILLRFLTGLGLGGAMPNVISLTSEYSPARLRATMISTMFCGFPLGAVLGGILAARMIPVFGWQSVFILGGIIPLLMVPILVFILPESVRYMTARGDTRSKISGILSKISGDSEIDPNSVFIVTEKKSKGFPVSHLLSEGRATRTILLWITFFMNLLMLYFLASWLPSVLRQAGIPIERAIISTVLLNLGGIFGALVLARISDRAGPYRILTASYLGAAAFTYALGISGLAFPTLMAIIFLTGFCVIGAQINMNALAAEAYPTTIRSTGVGWALGIGRIGSIIGPVVGGLLLSANIGTPSLFMAAALPGVIAAVAVVVLSRAKTLGVETAVVSQVEVGH
jgi:AAHS family 4-hydroxybenzoate transporter-like MFS transporter